jgi:protein-tyrosine phosphatase
MGVRTILFVCTANIARSPMATALFNHQMQKMGLDSRYVGESAGTWGVDGLPAARDGKRTMQARGLDISSHRSRVVTWEIMMNADLVLTMEGGHAEALRFEFRKKRDRIFLLSEMVGLPFDIDDPYNKGIKEFEGTARELEDILEKGISKIIQLADAGEVGSPPEGGQ